MSDSSAASCACGSAASACSAPAASAAPAAPTASSSTPGSNGSPVSGSESAAGRYSHGANGKGSAPRNISPRFRSNYDTISWTTEQVRREGAKTVKVYR